MRKSPVAAAFMERVSEVTNPLTSDAPSAWDRLIESIGPASILALIHLRMGDGLKRMYSAEDVFQESLLHAWRDRASCEWKDAATFRRWLLSIIDHRILDLADREGAVKRGEGRVNLSYADVAGGGSQSGASQWAGPIASTTPSRALVAIEQAAVMEAALRALPAELSEVVRMRLFEDRSLQEVADSLGIGLSAVAHRFRKGAAEYQRLVGKEFATRNEARTPRE